VCFHLEKTELIEVESEIMVTKGWGWQEGERDGMRLVSGYKVAVK
jgi:hypothetical protein